MICGNDIWMKRSLTLNGGSEVECWEAQGPSIPLLFPCFYGLGSLL